VLSYVVECQSVTVVAAVSASESWLTVEATRSAAIDTVPRHQLTVKSHTHTHTGQQPSLQ